MRAGQQTRDERFAASYDRALSAAERTFLGAARAALLSGVTGRVVDIGAGTGANLAHYDPLAEVTLVEPSESMRAQLLERLDRTPPGRHRPAALAASAEALPLPDGHADAVVCTLVLCSVPDQDTALREIVRVLRPGGTLAFLEHCRAGGLRGLVQRAWSPLTKRCAAGCRCDRDTLAVIGRTAGLSLEQSHPLPVPWPYGLLPENPFIAGRARRV